MKSVFGALAVGVLAAALWAGPADARPHCVWRGEAWHCWNSHYQTRADRAMIRSKRAEVRHDRRHLRHLQARLHRDIHVGSSNEVTRDMRKLRRAQRELREDRSDLRQDRRGY